MMMMMINIIIIIITNLWTEVYEICCVLYPLPHFLCMQMSFRVINLIIYAKQFRMHVK